MAPGHWQIIKHGENEKSCEGAAQALAVAAAPSEVVDIAMRAANLIGDGFYGVDVKERGDQCYIIEINDNPNVDAGNEDGMLKDALYREVMSVFRKRIEARKGSIA
jgi:glutathione synthase/RimK-type ligase-like ATP-grasp enzyme